MRSSATEQTLRPGHLRGKLLLAMPNMGDPRFERAVICMCEHSEEGAMGIVINQPATHIEFPELMEQLDISIPKIHADISVFTGGPVEPNRGFVLHSADYTQDSSMVISEILAITATVEILRALAANEGPSNSLLVLGYAGWSAGQLESEILANAWLHTETDSDLVFATEPELKWPLAMAKLGIDVSMLSSVAGHA
ncbi:MAG: YqgE/AlgH family protein [Alphaproteobacteria bacterium]|nr:MAG: YqgE/AlgH family protein [Alphaproteobacteria bacterium]